MSSQGPSRQNPPAADAPPDGTARRALAAGGRVHLIAIAGVGMAALAGMLRRRGYRVSGSDQAVYPPMSTLLRGLGIPVHEGFRAENLADRPDLVVVGNAVSRTNPEVAALLDSGLPYVSFPQALAELFLADKLPVVVAGTHGKTTSTAMLAWVLEQAGRDPSAFIGGQSIDFDGNFKLGNGPVFVVEGDEYDTAFFDKGPKFLHYRPQALLLTAVEFDHADIYRDLDHVKSSFRRLVEALPAAAPLLVSSEFPHALDVAAARQPQSFGLAGQPTWKADGLREGEDGCGFEILHEGRHEASATIRLAGSINARNALGVYATARALGLTPDEILPGLSRFRGVARRQEQVGTFSGITLVDDFAHHPTAVAGAIAAMRGRFRDRRLWALFEPRSNTSRRKVFQHEYVAALAAADRVVVAEVLRKPTDPISEADLFSVQQLTTDLRDAGVDARVGANAGEIAQLVQREAAAGDVVLMMSNGGFGGLRQLLVDALSRRSATA